MVHIGLEGGQGVAESKEHDSWFEKSEQGGEGGFPVVFWPNEDVVVSPSDVEFCKDFAVL